MLKCNNVFWLENFTDLFCDFRLIPFKDMNLESQMNAMTRLIFFIFIILLLFLDLKSSLTFLFLSILIIIFFYYIKKKRTKENFVNNNYKNVTNNKKMSNKKNIKYHNPYVFGDYKRADIQKNPNGKQEVVFNDPAAYTWYNDEVPFDFNNLSDYKDYNPEIQKRKNNVVSNNISDINNMYNGNNNDSTYMSMNQKLVGKPNPKTLIPPVIAPPIADLGYWKTNNLIVHSHINDQKQVDNYQSGYQVSTCCGANNKNMYLEDTEPKYLRKKPQAPSSNGYKRNNYQKNITNLYEYTETKENFELQQENDRKTKQKERIERYGENNNDLKIPYEIKPNQSGWVNTSCGYNPDQLFESALPTNYPAGECEKDSLFKEYNKNLFTQTIQPGVYSYNEVNEPINSNIGISYTQQFEPTTVHMDPSHDSVTYIEHDPRLYEEPIEPYVESVNEANVYDPRFTGYGTSYRAYTDENIGQTRFYYDDINSVRMPNYIVRSNIDFMKAADKYGPMMTKDGNRYNEEIRNLANDEFLKNSLTFRTGLQERLMRKANAIRWQQRQAPIHKNY